MPRRQLGFIIVIFTGGKENKESYFPDDENFTKPTMDGIDVKMERPTPEPDGEDARSTRPRLFLTFIA